MGMTFKEWKMVRLQFRDAVVQTTAAMRAAIAGLDDMADIKVGATDWSAREAGVTVADLSSFDRDLHFKEAWFEMRNTAIELQDRFRVTM